jgi:hypothetical protein
MRFCSFDESMNAALRICCFVIAFLIAGKVVVSFNDAFLVKGSGFASQNGIDEYGQWLMECEGEEEQDGSPDNHETRIWKAMGNCIDGYFPILSIGLPSRWSQSLKLIHSSDFYIALLNLRL